MRAPVPRAGLFLPALVTAPLVLPLLVCGVSTAQAAELTFEERVAAQRAIEQVYYSHQTGATRPFDEAVPRELLERKVRTYLKQSVVLEEFWRTPVTAAALQRELERIARNTRFPERLERIYAALDHDPVLIRECFARPALVDRLARSFFVFDRRIHAASRQEADRLRARLQRGGVNLAVQPPSRRSVVAISSRSDADAESGEWPAPRAPGEPQEINVGKEEFARWRARVPRQTRGVGPIVEMQAAFTVPALLADEGTSLTLAIYVVPKVTWGEWWAKTEGQLDEWKVETVASPDDATLPAPPHRPGGSWQDADDAVPVAGGGVSATLSCPQDDTWENGSLDDLPDPRSHHTAVWTGNEMIIWGGNDLDSFLNTGRRYDPVTDTWTRVSTLDAPHPRIGHTAVWTGSEMIVWGGYDDEGNPPLDTGGRYDPAADAWAPTSTAGVPQARSGHTAVWTGSEMIVWGGSDGSSDLDTGGRYDPVGDVWTTTSTHKAPAPRVEHVAVWTGSEMIVWGGRRGSPYDHLNTGGRYDPVADTWKRTNAGQAPEPRSAPEAVWTGTHMVAWGGYTGAGAVTSTGGRYDPAADRWEATSTVNAPEGRYDHTAVWTGSEMIVWGGWVDPMTGIMYNTGGRYDPVTDTWATTSTTNAPGGRARHTAVWTGSLMIVHGGEWGFDLSFSLESSDGRYDPIGDAWTLTAATTPTARFRHTAVWTGNLMIVWGGVQHWQTRRLNTGGRYDPLLDAWSPTALADAPAPREDHTAVWTGSEMIVWGGRGQGGDVDTGGRYDPSTDTWVPVNTTNAPGPRALHTAVWTGQAMIVWGGTGATGALGTGARYNPTINAWATVSGPHAPWPRYHHTAVWTGQEMIIWGGEDDSSYFQDGDRYDPFTNDWSPVSLVNAPSPRARHTGVWTGSEMIVWGGNGGSPSGYLDTGGRYDPVSDTWAPTSSADAPTARMGHTAVWSGNLMIVWGGIQNGWYPTSVDTGGRYDPVVDDWTITSVVATPLGRYLHTAVWTGTHMIIWGGGHGTWSYELRTGGAYSPGSLPDLDLDGFPDVCDNCPNLPNADQADADADLAGDLCDNCPTEYNPGLADGDSDGAGDACDCAPSDPGAFGEPVVISSLDVLDASGGYRIEWDDQAGVAGAGTVYDVYSGLGQLLHSSGGDFSTGSCLAEDVPDAFFDYAGPDPPVGDAIYFMIRAQNGCGAGTYGDPDRDAEAGASAAPCQ